MATPVNATNTGGKRWAALQLRRAETVPICSVLRLLVVKNSFVLTSCQRKGLVAQLPEARLICAAGKLSA